LLQIGCDERLAVFRAEDEVIVEASISVTHGKLGVAAPRLGGKMKMDRFLIVDIRNSNRIPLVEFYEDITELVAILGELCIFSKM
jgi:hypothetical protein